MGEADSRVSSEDRTVDKIKDAVNTMLEASVSEILRHVSDKAEFADAYCALTRTCLTKKGVGSRKDPFALSVDGIFPYGPFENERRYHSPNNIAPTALWLNYMKNIFVPGMLAMVTKYVNSDRHPEDVETLLKDMDDVYRVAMNTTYRKVTRLGAQYDGKQYEQHQVMWKAARPPEFSEVAESKLYRFVLTDPGADFDTSSIDIDRILSVVGEIETKFGCHLPRSSDGCPWPGLPTTMPNTWNWALCWTWFGERQWRMFDSCNKFWKQMDNTETLYLEFVWQVCDPSYSESLGLPMVAYFRHPLRVAVGKRVHGEQMRTGWKTIMPTSISDRDDSLSNVLFEACITNYLKHNFSTVDCQKILSEEVPKISIDQAYFDRQLRTQQLDLEVVEDLVDDIEDPGKVTGDQPSDLGEGPPIVVERINAAQGINDFENDDDDIDVGAQTSAQRIVKGVAALGDDDEKEEDDAAQAEDLLESAYPDAWNAMPSVETDIMNQARERVNDTGRTTVDELRSAAVNIINERLQDVSNGDDAGKLLYEVVRARILRKEDRWA